ncbi:MAG TPA: sugar ABC transporter permease, partial [Candidatus Hydrogenedentes bacterium]|nr:sugar ABC transporter permease [Candidatus Hydrogenedentota bacterium]
MSRDHGRSIFIAVFLAPALVLFSAFVALPGVRALLYSLQRWDGLTKARWVGLDNFTRLFCQGGPLLIAVGHNLFPLGGGGSLIFLLGFAFWAVVPP